MLKRIGAEESGEFKAVASGTLPCGKPVVVNADGTVSVVSGSAAAAGSITVFESADTDNSSATFDSNSNKVVIAYKDNGNSGYGTAIVGTVSGTSISFGTPVVYVSGSNGAISTTFDSNSNKVIIVSLHGVIVGTVSGTSISFGSMVQLHNNYVYTYTSVTIDSNSNKVVIAWSDGNNNRYGTAQVGTVSGTSISLGTAVVFESAEINWNGCTFDSNSNKVVIGYEDNPNSLSGTAIVGTVSGTNISFGSPVVFRSGSTSRINLDFDSTNNKVVITFNHSNLGKAIVGTVSGTSISFGTEATFHNATTSATAMVYDSNAQKVIISFENTATSEYGAFIEGTVSGTDISFGSATTFASINIGIYMGLAFDSNSNKAVSVFTNNSNSSYGTAVVYSPDSKNITSENYIGMSRGVAVQTGTAAAVGTPTVFEAAQANNVDITYDSNAQKVVIVFTDEGNSSYGNAIVGTVSGNAISYGSPVIFESAASAYTRIAYDANAQKVVVVYRDTGNSSYGTAIVGTVSGTSISFGSPVVFDSQSTIVFDIEYDSNAQKLVIIHRRSDNQGRAIVGTVSGTSISFGTSAVFNAAVTGRTRIAYDANAQKVVLAYEDAGNSSHGTAIVGTVSGTGISFGSEVVFEAATSSEVNLAYDSDSQKIVIGYRDQGDSNIGKAIVGTVSGTSISFGTAAAFGAGNDEYITVVYDSDAQKIVVAYSDTTTDGKLNVGTVSGTSITFGDEVQFESGRANYVNAVYDTVQKRVVIAYQDAGNSSHGTAVVFKPSTIATTRGEVASGQAASVDVIGSVSDNQIGLTAGQQYFVQNDGTIGTTAATPSVLAGTAISATELVVKT